MKGIYIQNISDNEVTMLIQGIIGGGQGEVNGYLFAAEMLQLQSHGFGICNIKMNTGGGNMVHAYSIFSAILDSTMHTRTINMGLVASAGSYIWLAGKERKWNDYAVGMIHDPIDKTGGASNGVIQKFKNSILTIYKAITGRSEEELSDKMKAETWMDASDAVNMGFLNSDDIIPTNKKLKIDLKNSSVDAVYAMVNQLNKPKMNAINTVLGLSNEASEESQLEKVNAIVTENSSLKADLETLKASNDELAAKVLENENKIAEEKKAKALELVENAIASGAIKEDSREVMLNFATLDYEGTKKVIGDKVIVAPDLTNMINANEDIVPKPVKDFEWYSKNDPEGLKAIKNTQPEVFAKMVNEYSTKYAKK